MTKRRVLVIAGILLIVLLLPLVTKDRRKTRLEGPALVEARHTEVVFSNGDLSLAGMLFVPTGEGPFPAAVVIQGSGTSQRDNPWYLTVARHLQENGVAVLLPDKRGSEKSKGDWTQASFVDLAGDALAAVAFVKAQKQFTYSKVGLIGMSQGGWIAPIAAATDAAVSFVVTMSGAAVTTDEQLLFEEVNNIAGFGTYRFIAQLVAPLTVKEISRSAFWKKIAGFDPLPHWRRVNVPVLAAFGEGDENVPVEESVKRLRGLNNSHISIKVYPQGGHGIVDPQTRRVQRAFLDDMTAFIKMRQEMR